MFDFVSKLKALAENYGILLLLEENDISEEFVIKLLVEEGLIDLDNYFNLDAELEEWKRIEE